MTLIDVIESYDNLIKQEKEKLTGLKNNIFRIGSLRLILVIAEFAICYFLWGNTFAVILSIIIAIIIYLILMVYHNRLFWKKKYSEILVQNSQDELNGLNYDFSAFDGAPERSDASHSFSFDLDMFGNRSFFQSINRTVTDYGKDQLAHTILNPLDSKNEIEKRQEAIKELTRKSELITHFLAKGMMVENRDLDIKNFPEQFNKSKTISSTFWRFMPFIAPVLFIALFILNVLNIVQGTYLIFGYSLLLIIALIPLKYIKDKVSFLTKKVDTLKSFARLFSIIESENFESDKLKEIQQVVRNNNNASVAIGQLRSYSDNLDQSFNVAGFLLLNPLLFWNVIYTRKIEKWIEKHQTQIEQWFDALAEFDSLVSLARFSYNHPDYTFPTVAEDFIFDGKALGHPMLHRDVCVRNDVKIDKQPFFLVVTGANMAGKSTYLRTVGINHTLACIGAPVCAESLSFYPSHLVTNLRTSDSLNDNESYFFAELKRLKMIIDRLQSGEELFIILDEILKGTNSEDKQKGSIALMKQLVSLNSNGIIATHDLLLGGLEQEYPDAIKNYRFEADIKNDHLSFSYKIREGIAQNMNACFLMKKMGITGL
jgi:hypothetical protein